MTRITTLILLTISCFTSTSGFSQGIEIVKLKSKIFKNTRKLRVYLPPGYHHSQTRYPVLYMNDGIATFHAYKIKSVVDSLITNEIIKPIIVVGIDNGGSTNKSKNPVRDRANEYLPWPELEEADSLNRIVSPKGSDYPLFLLNEVMPVINKKFRTKTGKMNTGLGGASYGALISLYTAIHHSDKIGYLLLESPSLYVYNHQIFEELTKIVQLPKTYIGMGTMEGETNETKVMALEDAKKLEEFITNKKGEEVILYIQNGGLHDFSYFANRFPEALKFLFSF
jgi:predicted alpha/beta superfamily hydrolase